MTNQLDAEEEEIEDEILVPEEEEKIIWPRYFMHISYDGTNYNGWQRQLNGKSIQAEIEGALSKLLRVERVVTIGCGRTDSGVHARNFYLHFTIAKEIENIDDVFFKLNMMLPFDLGLYKLWQVHDKAHARFDATERSYEYHIHRVRDPFVHQFSTFFPWPLDLEIMQKGAAKLLEYKDFASFCKSRGGQRTTICDLRTAYWEILPDKLIFHITANRFLRNMVRAIVGTLLDLGRGRITLDEFVKVIEGKKRANAGDSAKPQGLHLTEVKYPFID